MNKEIMTEETREMTPPPLTILSRRMSLVLNTLIVSAYVVITILTRPWGPWVGFAGFLLLAVGIHCATLVWVMLSFGKYMDAEEPAMGPTLALVLLNLVLGLIFSAGLVGILWLLGHFWLSGIKVIVSFVSVFVAYKSMFPVLSRKYQQALESTY